MSKVHANQVRSLFLEGLDSMQISKRLDISEAEVVDLLGAARSQGFAVNFTEEGKERGRRRGQFAAQLSRKDVKVTLPHVRCLEGSE